jgi:ribosome biogenesis SPOUT family RNA methylase Rps3
MNAIIIEPPSLKDLEILKKIAELMGAKSALLSEKEKKQWAGLRMTEIAESLPKYEISDEEIINMMQEAEQEVYGKSKK